MYSQGEDTLINALLENIDIIDELGDEDENEGLCVRKQTSASSFSSDDVDDTEETPSSHVVYIYKRPYRRRRRKSTDPKPLTKPSKRYIPIIIPRILKDDIRRKYAQMYANVMNSYDYELLLAFFRKFFTPCCSMTKIPSIDNPRPIIDIHSLDLIIYYNLILLQSAPDKITTVSNIQLKQRSDYEEDETELICSTHITYTQVYNICPVSISTGFIGESNRTNYLINSSKEMISSLKKRKFNEEVDFLLPALDRGLFDPVSGVFCQSKFSRLQDPQPFVIQAQMRLIIHPTKLIKSIIISPLPDRGYAACPSPNADAAICSH